MFHYADALFYAIRCISTDPVSRRSIRAEGGIDIRESVLRIVPTCFLHNVYAYD